MTANSAHHSVEWLGTSYRILLHAEQTGSRIGVFESLVQPGYGPPRHIHSREDETFHILSGEVEFWADGRMRSEGPGSV
ncbi:MAG: cupin domain-containing protein, partial [Mesorhizobium sp.]